MIKKNLEIENSSAVLTIQAVTSSGTILVAEKPSLTRLNVNVFGPFNIQIVHVVAKICWQMKMVQNPNV